MVHDPCSKARVQMFLIKCRQQRIPQKKFMLTRQIIRKSLPKYMPLMFLQDKDKGR